MRLEESAVAALEVSSNATGCPELVVWCQNFRAVKKCDERRNGSQAFLLLNQKAFM